MTVRWPLQKSRLVQEQNDTHRFVNNSISSTPKVSSLSLSLEEAADVTVVCSLIIISSSIIELKMMDDVSSSFDAKKK
jgi:hypothetical protein